ncbi:MAG: tRNA 2-thiouridine(34) synthase MnmA [Bacteroidetes bacterium]|nr:tRNA 2-thiouridine(34) synthase MnmA [Bacteroidota bacterium]
MSKKGKVLLAMSGGIDSSIAALLLHEQGFDVVGITMKTWDYASSGASSKETGCCSLDSINDARMLAVNLGFPHFILDIRKEFGDFIIDNFVDEYIAGRTPNPCVLCNTHIKWGALLKRADMLECDFIATGHYARIREENNRFVVSRGLDTNKDQSYVLWGLPQESLKRTLFPLQDFRKSEIKQMAIDNGYVDLAAKSESYEICFVPDNDYRGFLKRKVDGLEERVAGGDFIDRSGRILGKHKGYPFYTIGQRKGLVIAVGEPLHVLEIIPETNTVVLGSKEELEQQQMTVGKINLIKYASLPDSIELLTKIRYKDSGSMSTVSQQNDKLNVLFHNAVSAIAPGQSAVFYEGEDLIGGGFIERQNPILI